MFDFNKRINRRHGPILLVTALAFGLRLRALTLFQYHIDEFFTLAAANFIAQAGLPLYPTGLFYDPGLPFSYLDGLLFWLFGFSEALGRWPAVIFGTLAVVTVYWLGKRILGSAEMGVLAALWLALSLDSVEWSGRARMITLAQWLALLSVGLLWLGLRTESARHRLVFIASYGAALLTHFSTVVLIPAWFAATSVLWLVKATRLRRTLIRDALLLLAVCALALSSGVIFQPPPSVEFQTAGQGLETKVGLLTNKFLQIPSDVGHAWEAYSPYFLGRPHWPVLLLAGAGVAASLVRLARNRRRSSDIGALYLAVILFTAMLTLAFAIHPHWQRARYLLMQIQGIFLLLGVHGWREVVLLIPRPVRYGQVVGAVALAALVSLPFVADLKSILDAGATGWERYDQAFGYIRDNMSAGDKVISMHPPASLLYLNQSDYYLAQSSPKLIVRPDGQLGDRYSGALWLRSAEEFNEVLSGENRVWLAVQEFWLFNSYEGYLQQQILWQMDKLWGEGGVWTLAGRGGVWPLAQHLATEVEADFEGGARLAGFTAHPSAPAPGIPLQLTLFWQGNIPPGAKVFVHWRDAANNTIAQADHFIYDGKVPTSRWPALLANDTVIRDGATLFIPAELKPGRYRLVTGFYHPETFARLGVIGDQSGESAVILGEWLIE